MAPDGRDLIVYLVEREQTIVVEFQRVIQTIQKNHADEVASLRKEILALSRIQPPPRPAPTLCTGCGFPSPDHLPGCRVEDGDDEPIALRDPAIPPPGHWDAPL